jgi:hypothetical protein
MQSVVETIIEASNRIQSQDTQIDELQNKIDSDDDYFDDIYDAIVDKGQQPTRDDRSTYAPAIENISTGGGSTIVSKNITANGTYNASSDSADGYNPVTVNVQPNLQSKSTTQNGVVQPDSGYDGLSQVSVNVTPNLQNKTVNQNGIVTADQGYDGLDEVTVNVSGGAATIVPKSITNNGVYNASSDSADGYDPVTVNVQPSLQSKSVNPTTSQQVITPDNGYDGLDEVTVAAMRLQSKTVSPSTSQQTISPDNDKDGLSSVVINAMQLQSKNIAPTTSSQTILPDANKDGLSSVIVSGVTAAIDNNIVAGNIKKDVQILGVTGTYEGQGADVNKQYVFDIDASEINVPNGAEARFIFFYDNKLHTISNGYHYSYDITLSINNGVVSYTIGSATLVYQNSALNFDGDMWNTPVKDKKNAAVLIGDTVYWFTNNMSGTLYINRYNLTKGYISSDGTNIASDSNDLKISLGMQQFINCAFTIDNYIVIALQNGYIGIIKIDVDNPNSLSINAGGTASNYVLQSACIWNNKIVGITGGNVYIHALGDITSQQWTIDNTGWESYQIYNTSDRAEGMMLLPTSDYMFILGGAHQSNKVYIYENSSITEFKTIDNFYMKANSLVCVDGLLIRYGGSKNNISPAYNFMQVIGYNFFINSFDILTRSEKEINTSGYKNLKILNKQGSTAVSYRSIAKDIKQVIGWDSSGVSIYNAGIFTDLLKTYTFEFGGRIWFVGVGTNRNKIYSFDGLHLVEEYTIPSGWEKYDDASAVCVWHYELGQNTELTYGIYRIVEDNNSVYAQFSISHNLSTDAFSINVNNAHISKPSNTAAISFPAALNNKIYVFDEPNSVHGFWSLDLTISGATWSYYSPASGGTSALTISRVRTAGSVIYFIDDTRGDCVTFDILYSNEYHIVGFSNLANYDIVNIDKNTLYVMATNIMQLNKSALTVVYSNYQCNQNTKYGVLDNIVYEFGTGASVRYASKGITRQNIYKKNTQAQHQIIGNYSWNADGATGNLILTPYYNDNITEYDDYNIYSYTNFDNKLRLPDYTILNNTYYSFSRIIDTSQLDYIIMDKFQVENELLDTYSVEITPPSTDEQETIINDNVLALRLLLRGTYSGVNINVYIKDTSSSSYILTDRVRGNIYSDGYIDIAVEKSIYSIKFEISSSVSNQFTAELYNIVPIE